MGEARHRCLGGRGDSVDRVGEYGDQAWIVTLEACDDPAEELMNASLR